MSTPPHPVAPDTADASLPEADAAVSADHVPTPEHVPTRASTPTTPDEAGEGWLELVPQPGAAEDRVVATVTLDGTPIGRTTFAAWPRMLVIFELDLQPPHARGPVAEAVLTLLTHRFHAGDPPDHFVHVGLTDPDWVRWYKRSPLGPGAVLTGSLQGRIHYHDRLARLDDTWLDALVDDADAVDPTGLVLTYARELEVLDRLDTVAPDELLALLRAEVPSARIAALRELAQAPGVPTATRDAAHLYALLDPQFEVRRFASIGVSGILPGTVHHPGLAVMLEHLAHPLRSLDELGEPPPVPDGTPFDPAHGRRNKRQGILWILGALAGLAPPTPTVTAWREAHLPSLRQLLATQLDPATWPTGRDEALLSRAEAAVSPSGHRYALGAEGPLTLGELLRYTVLRWHVVQGLQRAEDDRFYWMIDMVDHLVPSAASPTGEARPEGEDRGWVRALFAPPPRTPDPGGPALPDDLIGRWHTLGQGIPLTLSPPG